MTGAIGRRLASLAGLTLPVYLRRTERHNLFVHHQVKWASAVARERGDALIPALAGRRVILFGRRVADAFGHTGHPFLVWDGLVAVVPHPSGANRWWNDPDNVAAASEFMREALA